MFETIHDLRPEQVDVSARQLVEGTAVLALIDSVVGVYVSFVPTPDKPGEADINCVVALGGTYVSCPLTREQHDNIVRPWVERNWKAIGARWRELINVRNEVKGEG